MNKLFLLLPFILPIEWDWRDVNGINYLSPLRNQHQPLGKHHILCGVCWGMASTSVMADRMNIKMKKNSLDNFLSVQNILDCSDAGSCDGGDDIQVYNYVMKNGVPAETCNVWTSESKECRKSMDCYTCHYNGTCSPIINYNRFFIESYDMIKGKDNIKYEIYRRGPISCSMEVTDNFDNYQSGIYSEYKDNIKPNHVVSIIGWGQEEGKEYWIVRNSWGVYFGMDGFFHITTDSLYNLGIGDWCSYPIVDNWYKN
jgi:cathepsin X